MPLDWEGDLITDSILSDEILIKDNHIAIEGNIRTN